MNFAGDDILDQWTTLTGLPPWAAGAMAAVLLVVLILLLRASKSAANGILAVIALAAIGAFVFGANGIGSWAGASRSAPGVAASPMPAAVACLDELAGERVLAACEGRIFAAPDIVAAAVSYTAAQIDNLAAIGNGEEPGQGSAIRRAIEADRFGLVAHVLATRDGCTMIACAIFARLTDTSRIVRHMNERLYEQLVARYEPAWAARPPVEVPPVASPTLSAAPPPHALPARGTSIDFPSAASIPPVSIMSDSGPEPVKPDATKSDAAKLDAAKPDSAKPDSAKPNSAKPNSAKTAPHEKPEKSQGRMPLPPQRKSAAKLPAAPVALTPSGTAENK